MFTSTTEHPIFECPSSRALLTERRWKSNHEIAPNCPRCASSNTKFCYYNNYSLSQPRYFCKGCRRYWTKGGSLRNVPVGGGCRKSRRSKSARQADQRVGLNCHVQNTFNNNESENSDGVNIDLAAVFAKFLNQDQDQSLSGASTETDQIENIMFVDHHQSQLQPSDLNIGFGEVDQGLPQLCLEDNELELDQFQDILADDHDNIGWTDHDGTSLLPNFDLQNLLQFQDFGEFSIENDHEETRFPSDLHIANYENWTSSFDL